MRFADTEALKEVLDAHLDAYAILWIEEKLKGILEAASAKELYMAYSLLNAKVNPIKKLNVKELNNKNLSTYLGVQKADTLQVARIYILSRVNILY